MIDSALFVGKKEDPFTAQALEHLAARTRRLTYALGAWGEPLPEKVLSFRGDYILSFLSRWIIPAAVLPRADQAAINFHPAPPQYPGVGCANFALYEGASTYGATCHHMLASVDTGSIIEVRRFPIPPEQTLRGLLEQTYEVQLGLFVDIVRLLAARQELPRSQELWARKPTTWKDLRQLQTLGAHMSGPEMGRRIRATSFGRWQPHLHVHGHRFEYRPG